MEVSIEPEKVVNGAEATEAEEHRFISHRQHHQWETEAEMHKESDVMTVIGREDVDDLISSQLAQKLSGGNVFEPEEMDVSVDTFSHPPADSVSHDSYVGSSAPTTTPSPASTPGMECPYSLASQENDTPSSPPEPDSPVTYVGTIPPSRNPTQAQFWLSWFNGHEVAVPANGQCAMLALYATTLNHPEAKLKLTPSVITDANIMKKMVYSLMVANLVQDFKGGLVDPIAELLRYHPACQPPESMDAAMAMLMTHWLKERDRFVAADVPNDVADRYLTTCGRLHVLPIILLLRNHESHFYGVGHGDIFLKWEAEGDPGYAQTLLDRYDWASKYTSKPSDVSVYEVDSDIGFVVSKAGKPIDLMDDTDAVNEVLRQSLPTRQRLDIAQVRMGWPPLDEVPYDVKEIEDHMLRQVREVQRNLGMDSYAVGTCSLGTEDLGMNLPRRASVVNRCRITASLYYQITKYCENQLIRKDRWLST
ncbi:hypothetical protein PHMEG_0004516 [Phytophthora megakarya]|uniref:Uncharacterized protein n=1 Tax=Phytophthora megakarya TaxID=4795 RepID=A0A225WTP8_9STRA|nr:hypothetical protein PHMEG_0004516 [Phytophthora megakarya]